MEDKICLYPFSHIFMTQLQVDSPYRLNCCSVNNNREMSCNGSMLENYNSEYFRDLRKAHYEGQGLEHPHCRVCKESEMRTGSSPRVMNNRHFLNQLDLDFDKVIKKIRDNDFMISIDDIKSMEYMPSNYCNYACIMCTSFASSQRYNAERKLGKATEYKFSEYEPEEFKEILDSVQLLGFAGGETLLQPRVLSMIDELIDRGATDKKISILTNLSKYDPVLYSKLERFEDCFMTFSIDGIGSVGEYQRRLSSWKDVSANLRAIRANHPRIEHVINYVVTAVSAVGIPSFLAWAYDNEIQDIIFSPVKNVPSLGIDALPVHVIARLKVELSEIAKLPVKPNLADFGKAVERASSFYDSHKHDDLLYRMFRNKMSKEDKIRSDGLKLDDIIPDLDLTDGR